MKPIKVWAAAVAAAWATLATGQAVAATCSQTCSATFNQCTASGGAHSPCMNSWMQCRNQCNGVSVKPQPAPAKPIQPASVAKPVKAVRPAQP